MCPMHTGDKQNPLLLKPTLPQELILVLVFGLASKIYFLVLAIVKTWNACDANRYQLKALQI
eukprot:SAG31_NODE_299_length_18114_cov_3.533777_4_plen_62_part_00